MCYSTKEFLSHHGVPFNEVNILLNPKAILKLIFEFKNIFPVVIVENEPISGYNRHRLRKALGLLGSGTN